MEFCFDVIDIDVGVDYLILWLEVYYEGNFGNVFVGVGFWLEIINEIGFLWFDDFVEFLK